MFILHLPQDIFSQSIPASEYTARRSKVMETIGKNLALINSAEQTPFVEAFQQDHEFYYLTGLDLANSALVLNGKTQEVILFRPEEGKTRYPGVSYPPTADPKTVGGIEDVRNAPELLRYLNRQVSQGIDTLYLVLGPEVYGAMDRAGMANLNMKRLNDPLDGRISREQNLAQKLKTYFPNISIKDLTHTIDDLRLVKSENELAILRKAGKITSEGETEGIKAAKAGRYEYEVAAAAEYASRRQGSPKTSYGTIAASGPNRYYLHYMANNRKLEQGDIMFMDYGILYENYATDCTRAWPIGRKLTDEELNAYNTALDATNAVIKAMKPSVTVDDLKKVAEEQYKKHGLGDRWFGYIGHYVGLSVHDVGPYDKPFVAGVVGNVEPIVSIPEKNIFFILENTVICTEKGGENVTADVPMEMEEIYKLLGIK